MTTQPDERYRTSSYRLEQEAPFKRWPELIGYLSSPGADGRPRFQQGDHVAILGPTGTGKSHMAFALAELRSYVLVVACKPKDELIDDAVARGYHLLPGNRLEIPYVDGHPHYRRVIYWPQLRQPKNGPPVPPQLLLRTERELQKPLVAGAIGYVRQNGHWCLIIDEGTWVCRDLGLQRDVDSALTQFRTLKASVIVLGQRPSWMGNYVLSQPTHLILFQTSHGDDLKKLGDISGMDTKAIQDLVRRLDFRAHEALYLNTREREMFRTVAPPR